MPDSDAGIRVLRFSNSILSAGAVESIDRSIRELGDARPLVLDCALLTEVTPAGLAALLELGRNATGFREIGLAQLSRPLTLAAIEAGLSERFSIFATTAACVRSFERAESPSCAP
jgi:hypothetical protein